MARQHPAVRLNRTPLTGQWEVVWLADDGSTITDRWPLHGDDAARLEDSVDHHDAPAVIDAAHLARQRAWSEATFGPGDRHRGVIAHIRSELDEIAADPTDITEWIDVVILALDGAWRAGAEPQQIIDTLVGKQARNEAREWPDWRTASPNQPIEHVRSSEPA